MNDAYFWLVTFLVFLPTLGAIGLMFIPSGNVQLVRMFTLGVTVAG